jgi:hypothetical protein
MHFQQVALTLLAFSSAHEGASLQASPAQHLFTISPPGVGISSRIVVERNPLQPLMSEDGWIVRLVKNALQPPIYFPPVHTEEGLQDALSKAWEFHRYTTPPAPILSRFFEPTSSPPRSASPLPLRTDSSTRMSPRPE